MALISVVIPYDGKWYFDAVLDGVRAAAAEHGHDLDVWIQEPGRSAREAVTARLEEHLADPAYAGAIAVHFLLRGELAERVRRFGKPVVLIGGRSEDLPVVRVDDVQIARRAVQHLIDLGHRNIAHLGGSAVAPDDFTIRADRVRGYSEAMRDAGLDGSATVRASDFEHEAAKRQAAGLLADDDRPTAVFAVVDDVAFGVLAAARDAGLEVPRDLSVIGIDDQEGAEEAGLTTMRQVPSAVGRAAVDRLLGRTHDDDQVIDAQLVVRTSTAALRPARRGLLSRFFARR